MRDRRRLIGLWALAVAVVAGAFTMLVLTQVGRGHPSVIRVAADGDDLWAYTQQRGGMQGVETAWWVSHDGGSTWESGVPGDAVPSEPEERACSAVACYRLVDGRRVERQDDGGRWRPELERPEGDTPPDAGDYREDWIEERSIAAVAPEGRDVAVLAAGEHGAMVRGESGGELGRWRAVPVGHSWDHAYRWPLIVIGDVAILVVGVGAVFGLLLIDRSRRRRAAATSASPF